MFLGVFESQLTFLSEKYLLPRHAAAYSQHELTTCKEKMKGLSIPKPGPHDYMNKNEAIKYSGFTSTEISEFAHSGKLKCQKLTTGLKITRQAIDSFKAQLKLANMN